jgi:hypothetical protein
VRDLFADARDGELNKGMAALVCAYSSVPFNLDPLHVVFSGQRH